MGTAKNKKMSDSEIQKIIYSKGVNFRKLYSEFYDYNDSDVILGLVSNRMIVNRVFELDKLLEKDKLREKDGFPRKIKLGKIIKPAKDGGDQAIIVPSADEEKLFHWSGEYSEGEGPSTGGTGEGEEGDVIGERPVRSEEGEGTGAGQGKSGEHGMGADAYEIGRILTDQFELPNIKEKGKKTSLTKFTYELSDFNNGHGQILAKKQTLKKIVKTNLALGRITKDEIPDTSNLLIIPQDHVYRILSKEKDYESQAIVFFVRDYSGSMQGKPTEAVVTQHIYINSWLIYQYKKQVISRFIVHDTDAEEVPDFYTYYNKNVAGGTDVSSAYKLVNKIVEEENLARDYNVYIFHGTDGDDWNEDGVKTIAELELMLGYTSRIGITIAENDYSAKGNSTVEKYLKASDLLESHSSILQMDSFRASEANEERLIKGIKTILE